MPNNRLRLLIAALTGVLAFAALTLALDLPARIVTGDKAQFAIQQLDSMRSPMLAIARQDNRPPDPERITEFVQLAQELKHRITGYLEISKYNPALLDHASRFAKASDAWLADEKLLRETQNRTGSSLARAEQHQVTAKGFMNTMETLADGEFPIHQDINRGRQAGRTLQIISALLVLYLLSLIFIFQRMTRKTLLDSFHEVQEARRDFAQRERYLSLMLDSIGDAVMAADTGGRITRMNPVAENLTGWHEDDAIGKPLKHVFNIVNADTHEPMPDPVEKILQCSEVIKPDGFTMLISRNGNEYRIADSGAPIHDDTGNILGVILVFRDVSQEYVLQDELRKHRDNLETRVSERTLALEQSNSELESFSYAVSHDLRAPLRSINGFSELLLEDYNEQLDDTGKDYLKRIATAARHMGELIDALLILSRVTRKDIRHTDVNLSQVAGEIIRELVKQAPERDVEWIISPGLHAKGDSDLLRITLENLLGNAWKYSNRNTGRTRIEFGSVELNGEQVFFVRDNGCGFNDKYIDKLFTAFQRLHGNEFEGTGIGLATVHRIISRHNGRIWAKNNTDEGCTFYFTLG